MVELTLVNLPPSSTVPAFGPASSVVTVPLTVGRDVMRPVAESKIARFEAVRSGPPTLASRLKVPPRTTLLPTVAMACTEAVPLPSSRTYGVAADGTVSTRSATIGCCNRRRAWGRATHESQGQDRGTGEACAAASRACHSFSLVVAVAVRSPREAVRR